MNNDKIQELKRLAETATPGPWAYQEDSDVYTHIVRPVASPGWIIASATQTSKPEGEANGRFIAAANPAAVLELIAIIERATPAAASAGAAGTIDTPEFRALLNAFGLVWEDDNRSARNALIADIDQHTAAARKEGYDQGRYDESMAQGPSPAEWAKIDAERDSAGQAQATEGVELAGIARGFESGDWIDHDLGGTITLHYESPAEAKAAFSIIERAATAPVSATLTAGDAADDHQQAVSDLRKAAFERDMDAIFPAQIRVFDAFRRAALPQSAGAPVSNAPDAWITPQVAQNLDRQYRDGFQAGWTACIDGNEEALGAVLNRVKPLADYQEGAPVSADDQFCDANCTWLDHAPGCVRAEAAPVSAAEPFDHDQYITLGDRPMTPEQVHAALDHAQSVAAGQQLPTTYRQVAGWESARMEPDPAGEWVKRADLAMGQAQGEKDGERLRWLIEDHDDADVRDQARALAARLGTSSYYAITRDIDLAMAEIAAKQAGKEST